MDGVKRSQRLAVGEEGEGEGEGECFEDEWNGVGSLYGMCVWDV